MKVLFVLLSSNSITHMVRQSVVNALEDFKFLGVMYFFFYFKIESRFYGENFAHRSISTL